MRVRFEDKEGQWWEMDARKWSYLSPGAGDAKSSGDNSYCEIVGTLPEPDEVTFNVRGPVTRSGTPEAEVA